MCYGQCGVEKWHLETSCAESCRVWAGERWRAEKEGNRGPSVHLVGVVLALVFFPSAGDTQFLLHCVPRASSCLCPQSVSPQFCERHCWLQGSGGRLLHPRAGPTARLESPGTNRWPFGISSLAPPLCKKQMAPGSADHLEECPPEGNHTVGHRRDLLPSSAFGSAPSQLSKQRLLRLGVCGLSQPLRVLQLLGF